MSLDTRWRGLCDKSAKQGEGLRREGRGHRGRRLWRGFRP